jgi:glycosyltransferase involved in cell wall biosynthesis
MSHLLHPEYIESIPVLGMSTADLLDDYARTEAIRRSYDGGVTVAVRTLNEGDSLQSLLSDVVAQQFAGEIELVVIDNNSTDHTRDIARDFGAEIVRLPREEFSYPRSMNLGVEAASFDSVFLTVGHANLSNDQLLRAGTCYFNQPGTEVVGVFAHALPGANASRTELLLALGNKSLLKRQQVVKGGLGVLAATGAMISKSAWRELGTFDERYQTGGEDGAMAKAMLSAGYKLIDEPLLSVHHTHGLGPIDTAKQWRHWFKTAQPQALDLNELAKRRPDLDFS